MIKFNRTDQSPAATGYTRYSNIMWTAGTVRPQQVDPHHTEDETLCSL